MSLALEAAMVVSALSAIVAIPVVVRLRDPRLLALPLTLGLLAVRAITGVVLPANTEVVRAMNDALELAASLLFLVVVLIVGRIIRELGNAQAAAETERRLLETALDSLPHPFYMIRPSDRKVTLANSFARLRAVTLAPTCHEMTHDATSACSGPEHPCPLEEVVETGRPVTVEHVHRAPDGTPRYRELHACPVLDEHGHVREVIEYSIDVTDRKAAEEATRLSDRRFRWAFESATEGLYVADVDGRIIMTNGMMGRILGVPLSPDGVAGLATIRDIPYVQASRRQEVTKQLLLADELRGLESEVRRFDGKLIWVSENVRLTRRPDGEVTGVEGSLVDVTERIEMERSLRRALERLAMLNQVERANLTFSGDRPIARTAVDGVLSVIHADVAFVVRYEASPANARVIAAQPATGSWPADGDSLPLEAFTDGWEAAGPTVRRFEDLATLPDRSPLQDLFLQQGLRSVIRAQLHAQQHPTGELLVATRRPVAFTQEDLWVVQELADTLAAGLHQALLRGTLFAEQERLKLALSALPTGVALLDSSARILLANPAARALLPLVTSSSAEGPVTQIGGRLLEELVSESRPDHWVEMPGSDADSRCFEVLVDRLSLGSGASGYVLVLLETTKERSVERQLRLQERLAGIGQLAAGIAHDFNNLLQGIEMDAERVLGSPPLSSSVLQATRAIAMRAQRGARLIRQILDFCRASSALKERINLSRLLEEHITLLQRTMPSTIEIRLEQHPEDLWILGDETQVLQVMANLATNARDAMPEGGELLVEASKVTVDGRELPPVAGMCSGSWVRLRVSDTGTGIPIELQPRIFEPFFTTKMPGEGTGLGLPQVYGIVQQLGGFIEFTSKPAEGTVFSLYLPEMAEGTGPIRAAATKAARMRQGNGELILLVEDDPDLLDPISRALESLGYSALIADRASRALDLFIENRDQLALVLSDLVMPGMSGLDLSARLLDLDPKARVLLMSGYPPGDALGIEHPNVVGWMTKPFSTMALGQAIAEALGLPPEYNEDNRNR